MTPVVPRQHAEEKFSFGLFGLTMLLTFVGILAIIRVVAPEAVWQAQWQAPLWKFLAAFLAIHLVGSLAEYVLHRYILHKPVLPIFSRFYRQHNLHHSLTRISQRKTASGSDVSFVENIYPITEPHQSEASFTPWYTTTLFCVVFAPFLSLLQWAVPGYPWLVAGFLGVFFSQSLYETVHAIEHWPFERWEPLITHPRFGGFWRRYYSYHLRHHAVVESNENVAGFFLLPVWDWVFGTFVLPQTLYPHGSEPRASEFTEPRPRAFLRWCDRWADETVRARRTRQGQSS